MWHGTDRVEKQDTLGLVDLVDHPGSWRQLSQLGLERPGLFGREIAVMGQCRVAFDGNLRDGKASHGLNEARSLANEAREAMTGEQVAFGALDITLVHSQHGPSCQRSSDFPARMGGR